MLSTKTLLVLMAFSLMSVAGCGGGSAVAPDLPPRITAVTPVGALGIPGEVVTLQAVVEGDATSWEWTFGAGTVPTSSFDVQPSITLGALGTYNGSVIARNATGASTPFTFQYEVVAAPVLPRVIAVLGLDGNVEGDAVTASAITNGNPTTWRWNFDDGVAGPRVHTVADPEIHLWFAGTYSGNVVVGNVDGESEPFPFTFTVAVSSIAPKVFAPVRYGRVGRTGDPFQWRMHFAGNPVTWDWDLGAGSIPATSNDLHPNVILGPPGNYVGSATGHNSRGDFTRQFSYIVEAAGPVPPAYTKSDPFITVSNGLFMGDTAITLLDGLPTVVYSETTPASSMGPVYWVQATSEHPTGPADWSRHEIDFLIGALHRTSPSIVPIDGRIWVGFVAPGGYRVLSAETLRPAATSDWTALTIPGFTAYGHLTGYRGRPALTVANELVPGRDSGFRVLVGHALSPNPATVTDWDLAQVGDSIWKLNALGLAASDQHLGLIWNDELLKCTIATGNNPVPQMNPDWIGVDAITISQPQMINDRIVFTFQRPLLEYYSPNSAPTELFLMRAMGPNPAIGGWQIYSLGPVAENGVPTAVAEWDDRLIAGALAEGTRTQELFRELVPNAPNGGQWHSLALPDAPAGVPSTLLPLSDGLAVVSTTADGGIIWGELEGSW